MSELSRRDALLLGAGTILLGAVGCARINPTGAATTRTPSPASPPTAASSPAPTQDATFAGWLQQRQAPYLIAHRGAGTTVPEHSLPGYLVALGWGAQAMEISVVRSSDGVLYCHHDLTLDRTTTLTGATAGTDSATFDTGRIRIPRLGPKWAGESMPAIPRLEAVLDAVAGRAVLLMEAKDDLAFEPMLALLTERGLLDRIMIKANFVTARIGQAKQAGLPVFAYLGSGSVATPANVDAVVPKLDSRTDAIGLPVRDEQGAALSDDVFRHAVASGVATWTFAVHRRSELAHLAGLGVTGFITPALGYLAGTLAPATGDSFATGGLAPGLTTKDPYADSYALDWSVPAAIGLAAAGTDGARFTCLGDLCPIAGATGSYGIELEASRRSGTLGSGDAFVLAFGCTDDAYAAGTRSGYQAWVGPDGVRLLATGTDGTSAPLAPGTRVAKLDGAGWTRLRIDVTPQAITVSVDGVVAITVADQTWRGPYLHVGRNQGAAMLAVRQVRIVAG